MNDWMIHYSKVAIIILIPIPMKICFILCCIFKEETAVRLAEGPSMHNSNIIECLTIHLELLVN